MTHIILKEQAEYDGLKEEKISFFIHKINKYSIDPGETLIFQELKSGDHTGGEFTATATNVLTEGLLKNHQAVQIKLKEPNY